MNSFKILGLAVVAGLMLGGCAGRWGGDGIDGLAMANIVRQAYSQPSTTPPSTTPHN